MMIKSDLVLGTKLQELKDDIKQIYIDSFPVNERRDWHDLEQILLNPFFSLIPVVADQKIIGLISIWKLEDFIFIEHFAIEKSFQGNGIGSQILKQIIHANSIKIVVEVEPPTTDLSRRRITFYERLGFLTCENIYWQPPYSPDKDKVKMQLMSFPDKILPLKFIDIKVQLYKEVYLWKDSHVC